MTSDWVKYKNSHGKTYYYNRKKHISQWEVPKDYVSSDKLKWYKNVEADGTESYYNIRNAEIVYKRPDDYVDTPEYSPDEKPSGSSSYSRNKSGRNSSKGHHSSSRSSNRSRDRSSSSSSSSKDSKKSSHLNTISNKDLEYNDRTRLRKFKDLLAEKIKTSNISWEDACEIIKKDIRFSLLTSNDMKRVFLSFRSKMIQEEKLSENDVIENKRRNLEEFLLNDSRINSSHKYPELDEIYEHEDVWTDLPDSYRRKVVEKINPQLLNRELRQLKLMRDTNIEKIKILFKTIPGINYKITWAETQQLLLENEEFMSDKDLQNMDKEDALNIFQDHIIELERVHKEEIEFIEQSKRLYYAECREKFWELLQKLYDWRKIHKDSSWKQIYPLIKEENEFKNMLGIPGSSPLDIFKIFHFDMRTNYLHDTEVIEKVMKSHSIEIHSRTSFESFYSNLKHYSETSSTRRSNMLMYYDMMMSKLKKVKRKVDAFTPYEKKRVAFKKILYRLGNKVITKTTKYNEVIRRISDTPEFKDFNDENEKYRIFKKMRLYLNRDSKNTPNADYSNSSESTDSASSMNFSE